MDDAEQLAAERIVERLKRISELDHDAAPALLLDELRKLVSEAEQWARLEGDERARTAVEDLDRALAAIGEPRARASTVRSIVKERG
ncbi:MAG TPA: hypothetical protein VMV08_02495 [Gaiellaceae bacterium]|nr:hypothetical protein [Gaiellaceae bacterium]